MATASERFWAKVDKSGDCWIWLASTAGAGYGGFYIGGGREARRRAYAHRWAYAELVGPIPDDMELDHRCRNRRCVNPAHLEPVTHSENHRRREGIRTGPYDVGAQCRNGHPRTPENAGTNSAGHRFCKPCHRDAVRRARAKKSGQM